jgi:AraC-like DNA-binding protein
MREQAMQIDPPPRRTTCACHALRSASRTLEEVRSALTSPNAMDSGALVAALADCALVRDTTLAGCECCDSVVDAVRFTVANLADSRLTLARVARATNVSRWHLSRQVVRCTSGGFANHVQRLRVLAALRVLRDTRLSVKETAAEVGLRGSAELHRQMTRHLGVAPSSARRMVRLNTNVPGCRLGARSSSHPVGRYQSASPLDDGLARHPTKPRPVP